MYKDSVCRGAGGKAPNPRQSIEGRSDFDHSNDMPKGGGQGKESDSRMLFALMVLGPVVGGRWGRWYG